MCLCLCHCFLLLAFPPFLVVRCHRIGRRALDDARESLAEHLALLSPSTPQAMTTVTRPSASPGLPDDHDSGNTAASEEGTHKDVPLEGKHACG